MLVLTRKSDESIKLGDDIEITVIEVKGNSVRLGISAPASLRIYRKEIYDRIKEENLRSKDMPIDEFAKISEKLRSK